MAYAEARGFLDHDQYEHVAAQVRELALHDDPTHSATIDVRPIEGFFEIRDKGGPLRRLNVRVFFALDKPSHTLVVLGTINKKNDGHTPAGDRLRMRRRRRLYLEHHRSTS